MHRTLDELVSSPKAKPKVPSPKAINYINSHSDKVLYDRFATDFAKASKKHEVED